MVRQARLRQLPKATLRSPAPELGPRAIRMIERILDATRTVFMSKGYAGTTIDDITGAAGISRPSFYTYFPTKRDVLLALGAGAAEAGESMIAEFAAAHPRRTVAEMRRLVDRYFDFFARHGAFAIAFTQASADDEEIRVSGMLRHLHVVSQLGRYLAGEDAENPAMVGLAAYSMLERAWRFAGLYHDRVGVDELRDELARALHRAFVTKRPR